MKLFAQHGFSDGLKTVEGLRKELIDGVIFSPRDITPEKLRESASKFTESAPISERLFDPQYYAKGSAQIGVKISFKDVGVTALS